MIKVIFGIRKRADISYEEFWERWHVGHAALAREIAPIIGLRKYTQNLGVHPEISKLFNDERKGEPPFDGFAEAWFDSMEAMAKARASVEGAKAFQCFLEDELRFLDVTKCSFSLTEEHPIIGSETII